MSNSTENIRADFVRISSGFNTEITGKLYLNKYDMNQVAQNVSNIKPAAVVVAAGKYNHNNNDGVSISIPATGIVATDLVFASLESTTNSAYILRVTPSLNVITVECSANPGNSKVNWQGLRLTP